MSDGGGGSLRQGVYHCTSMYDGGMLKQGVYTHCTSMSDGGLLRQGVYHCTSMSDGGWGLVKTKCVPLYKHV